MSQKKLDIIKSGDKDGHKTNVGLIVGSISEIKRENELFIVNKTRKLKIAIKK